MKIFGFVYIKYFPSLFCESFEILKIKIKLIFKYLKFASISTVDAIDASVIRAALDFDCEISPIYLRLGYRLLGDACLCTQAVRVHVHKECQ